MTVTADTTAPTQNRLTVAQMLHVMRVEFQRARTMKYPMACFMVAVDGLDELQERHGYQCKQFLMRATYDLLRRVTHQKGMFGMALMSGDRLMAVFPNMVPQRASELGELYNGGARALELPIGGETVRLKLSLGASHNLHEETSTFEGLVQGAGRALQVARDAGGDRYIMWREAEAELDSVRGELEASVRRFKEQHAVLVEETNEVGGLHTAGIIDKIQSIFGTVERTEEIQRLEKEVIALAAKELHEERQRAVQAAVAENARQIDMLERRIAKLTSMLGVTEEELQRVMTLKGIDPGVASIYRTVQGLSHNDAHAEAKASMMADIFKANFELQKRATAS
ncbi:MAG: GGDEF domain-containing protein [Planctomycetota bacterium]